MLISQRMCGACRTNCMHTNCAEHLNRCNAAAVIDADVTRALIEDLSNASTLTGLVGKSKHVEVILQVLFTFGRNVRSYPSGS